MNEVRAVCAAMLDDPEPPQQGVNAVLARARRVGRRRARTRFGALCAALLAILLGIVPATGAGTLSSADRAGEASAPVARAAAAHGREMAQVLRTAVPPGLVSEVEPSFSDQEVSQPATSTSVSNPRILAAAGVTVRSSETHAGRLFAYLMYDGQPAPDDDLCAPRIAYRVGSRGSCEVLEADGTPIRLIVSLDPANGRVLQATRFLGDGWLTVGAAQGVSGKRPLTAPPLDSYQVATLAADPAMLPAR